LMVKFVTWWIWLATENEKKGYETIVIFLLIFISSGVFVGTFRPPQLFLHCLGLAAGWESQRS
jgi:membrane protein DedA with SNARE-associated domain